MKLTDLMDHLSDMAFEAEMFALELKHEGGDKREQEEAKAEAAKYRRDHRALFIKALYHLTGSSEPDYGEPNIIEELRARMAEKRDGAA